MGPSPFSDGRHPRQANLHRPRPHLASMGPSPFSDGRRKEGWGPHQISELQWGHRLSAMEGTSPGGCLKGTSPGFNGAIAFQRWKAAILIGEGFHPIQLQWGHRLSAMEGGYVAPVGTPPGNASMGPSPFSDGRGEVYGTRGSSNQGFNGAIAFQRWKVLPSAGKPAPLGPGFNGAIAFQRWKGLLL